MRLFFALWPESDVARQFAHAASQLQQSSPARLVNFRNYHLTLAFLGEVSAANLVVLQQIGGRQRASCCNIVFGGLEYWPDPKVVVSIAQVFPTALYDLSAQLRGAADQHRLTATSPAPQFRAHVTLARKVAQAPVLPTVPPFSWSVNSFSLVRSDASGDESVYTVVDTWPLLYEK
ncbi:MAG TPA: RNA 2',3'-cyclic phosphodiesterase [Steroidobacteraceae bacterium]